ncbi:MAG: FxSxx-COOH system tetratricopeptide repeat protein, partial [Tepidisphaeraceae bacterium]
MSESSTRIFNVPQERNPHFVGRDETIAEIRRRLSGSIPIARTQVLAGAGGMGKSQIAVEYACRHRDEYAVVWWVRANDPLAMQHDLVQLGQRLNVAPGETSAHVIIEALRGRLAGRADWLLIFDDAPGPGALVHSAPRERTGHVIVTTRNSDWPDAPGLSIGPLTREEAIFLVRKRAGKGASVLTAGRLAQALGDVPLAVEQAAALMQHRGLSVEEYLRRFETHWGELLQRGPANTADYPSAVAMTVEMSFRELQDESPAAAQLLALCAYFAPSGIPLNLLRDGAMFVPDPISGVVEDASKLERALRLMKAYALGDFHDTRLFIQEIVSTIVRRRLSSDSRKQMARVAIRLADHAFRFDSEDLSTWAKCAAVLPHVDRAIAHALDQDVAHETAALLLNDIGELLNRHARYTESRLCLDRALKIGRKVWNEDHGKLRTIANNLARVLARLGELNAARKQIEDTLKAEQQAKGENHPKVADLLNNYGTCLHKAGEYDKAREVFGRALSIYDLHAINREPRAASIINNLGYLFMKTGNLVGAKELLHKALKLATEGYGPEHPDVAAILNNIGDLQFLRGDYSSARHNYEKALKIDQAVYGGDHPEVARHLGDLGRVMLQTHDARGAITQLRRALSIEEAAYGALHPDVGDRLLELARALHAAGETTEA